MTHSHGQADTKKPRAALPSSSMVSAGASLISDALASGCPAPEDLARRVYIAMAKKAQD